MSHKIETLALHAGHTPDSDTLSRAVDRKSTRLNSSHYS